MIYIDEELVPRAVHDNGPMGDMTLRRLERRSGRPLHLGQPDLHRPSPRPGQISAALGRPAAARDPAGPDPEAGLDRRPRRAAPRPGSGFPPATSFDAALAAQVKEFQAVHGLKDDGIAGAGTIEALNRGAEYYEQLIIINMERAKRLPAPEEQPKYAIVDAGDARLSMWENGRKVDEMKVVVGKAETATPMMAAYIKYASVNPYWNVPPELVKKPDRAAHRRARRQLPHRPRISGPDRLRR